MSDLGALLRKARDQRGLSLDDIQDLTKIRKHYLEAIEEGNYSVLPGTFYVRAFVKNYAENVGLDADEVLRLYQKEIPSAAPEQITEPVQRPRRSQTPTSDGWSRFGFRILMWSFLLLIVIVVYVFAINRPGGKDMESVDQTGMTDKTEPPVSGGTGKKPEDGGTNAGKEPDTNDGETPGTDTGNGTDGSTPQGPDNSQTPQTMTLTLDRSTGKTDYYIYSPGAGKHTITFKLTGGSSWVGINQNSKSGKSLYQKTLQDGESDSAEVEGQIYINIAHANLVEVTIDGVLIEDKDQTGSHKMQLTPAEDTDTATGKTDQNQNNAPESQ
ncbi:helix-turn-helix domain-containing protein [Paenibacillus nasutitermitis]|uniref:XRE family transcriptional regulator n=1 Tax=Paenibacillus nasutitermitis TaxID=1652958 RepID=A0A917DU97_9BACL|nr:RodZ domain-containing protein [Paenibacillus nasutitermitis]GGD67766.1 XRE family transcriptional regulator [Paenibacillus nasutitermitis]